MTLAHVLAAIGIGNGEFLMILAVLAMAVGLTAFWIRMLVDCAKRISAGENNLIGWLIAIALAQVFGAAAYFLFGRHTQPHAS